jgi:tetratricopeptide (TPR) repeat protein
MKTNPLSISICMISLFLLSPERSYPQGFQTKEVSDKVVIVSNPDLGDQVVVESEKGLLIFDSFWSVKTARLFKDEISKALHRNDFSYVINMVDRLDMIGGNNAYEGAVILGHENILNKYANEETVRSERAELINMWKEKAGYSRNRLKEFEDGSKEASEEEEWMNICMRRADELQNDFSLMLPNIYYNDRIKLDLGDITMNLFWFGKAGNYHGLTMAIIPEEKLAILNKAIIYPVYHLAPYVHLDYGDLDVPRWISLLEEILEGDNIVDNIILSDDDQIYSRDVWLGHLKYIRKLWESVRIADDQGLDLREIQDQLSLDKDFAFVKEMPVYKNNSDQWIRPQHELHVKLFYLQGKNLASEIIKDGGVESIGNSLNKINKLGSDVYFDEIYMNMIGYNWLNMGHIPEAIEVFKLNVEAFPGSSNVYDSLGEAYFKNGDTKNAINNYRKSLELDPGNANAKEMLSNLGGI